MKRRRDPLDYFAPVCLIVLGVIVACIAYLHAAAPAEHGVCLHAVEDRP